MPVGKVVIIGSVAFDAIEGPGGSVKDTLGGSATYASYAASFFAPVGIVACVGEDFPQDAKDVIAERGADLSGLARLPGRTFRWAGKYAPGFRGRETLKLDLGVFASFTPVLSGALKAEDVLLLGNIDPDLQLKVLEQAGDRAFVAADTIDHWIRNKRESLMKGLARTDLFFLNDEEAELLTGESNLIAAGREIRKMGPRNVVIKKGEHGAMLFGEGEMAALPALPLEQVKDPTGAGDVFAGAMLGYIAGKGKGRSGALREGMARGIVMSSFVVEEFSVGRLRGLKPEEIDRRLSRLRELVRF